MHTTEKCKARKKAEKKLERESRASRTPLVTSNTISTALPRAPPQLQTQASQIPPQSPVVQLTMQQVPLQTTGIEEKLQKLAHRVDPLTVSRMMPPSPAPPAYTSAESEDGNQAYSTTRSTHLIPTSDTQYVWV